jgi:hypothetical protein
MTDKPQREHYEFALAWIANKKPYGESGSHAVIELAKMGVESCATK